jgi:hypothetical protein
MMMMWSLLHLYWYTPNYWIVNIRSVSRCCSNKGDTQFEYRPGHRQSWLTILAVLLSFLQVAASWNLLRPFISYFRYEQTTWCVSDSHERLETVAVEVFAMPCWKHLPQVSVLDSSSSRAVKSILWVTWTFCLCFKISSPSVV